MKNICIKCGIDIPENAQVCPVCGADNSARAPAPCKDCTERHSVCHDTCIRYIVWKARRSAKLEIARLQKDCRLYKP